MNTTERFDESKLPKHCLNAKGLILDELKRPAPSEFREMYKEGRIPAWASHRGLSRQVAARARLAESASRHAAPADHAAVAGAAAADAEHAVACSAAADHVGARAAVDGNAAVNRFAATHATAIGECTAADATTNGKLADTHAAAINRFAATHATTTDKLADATDTNVLWELLCSDTGLR